MKTILSHIALFTLFITGDAFAQDVTTVRANNSDISDNLDLRAVASIFGESSDLEDFERRLNDPDMQISNLDLNGDNRVDYLRVIEATERNTHLIIIQSVLGADVYQDVATIEVERDKSNNVQVQVVGDVYMYGANYIYEPVYAYTPFIFDIFWVSSYRPYYSPWYWGYYPTYYSYWAPCAPYRYRNHIHTYVNPRNTYVYTPTRNSSRAQNMYSGRRQNGYEKMHPNNSFSSRNKNVNNRYALEQNRGGTRGGRPTEATRSSFTNSSRLNNVSSSNINTVRKNGNAVKDNDYKIEKSSRGVRNADAPARTSNSAVRSNSRQEMSQPERIERSSQISRNVERSAPAPSRNVQREAPSIQRSAPVQSSRDYSAPSRNNAPSMRSTPSAPQRQSAPAPASRGNGGGNSRRN